MTDHLAILRAADMAARWHAAQRRKGATAEPYVNHLIEVAYLVAAAGGEADTIVAALLHDAIEDQKIPATVIAAEFGADVAAIVLEVTDDKLLPKETRKTEQIVTAAHKSRRAKLVKLADKIANVRSVTRDPPVGWSVERQRTYVTWSGEVVAGLHGVSPFLEAEFADAVGKFREGRAYQHDAD
jgi:(p)ppGpp synthase/HD superfamily hydrolase